MKVLGIIQARMSSTRLPRKVLLDLAGKSVLEHVISRVARANRVSDIVVATTIKKEDLAIVKLCASLGYSVFCGSENDVLDRFYQVARLFEADQCVRITADCPMMDPGLIDQVLHLHQESGSDYTANILEETFPDGEDIEVFTFEALENAWENASLTSEREHVTPYIRKHPELFKLTNLRAPENLAEKRWTIDNAEDYEFLTRVFKELYHQNPFFGMNDILTLLDLHPELEQINRHIQRNEGYQKSLKEDKKIRSDSD
jgi:spore coat polysaccharide biosynthesis protein SpsF (cytidylyltransferase family)